MTVTLVTGELTCRLTGEKKGRDRGNPKINAAFRVDSFLLSAFGMAWAIHKRAAHEIGNPGFVWTVKNATGGQTLSPWIKILNQQAMILASLGDRLGLDPKSRAALKLPAARQQRAKFEGLIGPIGYNRPLCN